MVSARRGWGTQRANPGAPAAQSLCLPVPRGPCTQWATTGAPDAFYGATSTGDQAPREPTLGSLQHSAVVRLRPGYSAPSGPPLRRPVERNGGPGTGTNLRRRNRAPGLHAHNNATRQVLNGRGVWTAKTVKQPLQQPAQPPIRQLLGAADAQTAHHATSSTAPAHRPLGSANAETAPAGAAAAAADRTQRPDAACEGNNR